MELADRLAGAGGQGGAADPNKPGDGKGRDAQSRIQQLVRERNEAREAWEKLNSDHHALREEVAELRGAVTRAGDGGNNGMTEDGEIRSWSDVPDGALSKAFQMGLQSDTPETAFQAVVERVRRDLSKHGDEVLNKGRQEIEAREYQSRVEQRIMSDFGDEAANPDSELVRRAGAYANSFRQRYGKDALDRMPDLAHTAFMLADRDVNSGSIKDRMAQLERENESFRRRLSVEPGMPPGAQKAPDEYHELLKQGNVKGALRSLRSVRSFDGE